ncbi:MAG: U32 family peptidase, partial [Alistipes sp.]|nr:U32 family peptidase [Alistipes sp.]
MNRAIELLAPARDLATGRVAVDSGADAVYIGGPGFGARRAAGNSLEDVAELVRYARPFGVRVYATLNTLLFDDEVYEARRVAAGLVEAGVDALIVQDMAFMRMGINGMGACDSSNSTIETFELRSEPEKVGVLGISAAAVAAHASTQTCNMIPEEVAFLGRSGFRRVILERALSLAEIRAIRAACPDEIEL